MNTMEQERQAAKMTGIRRAWQGIPDPDKKAAIAFYINYAKRHEEFEGGDVLAAWRRTDDPIAQQDWRNRWGGLAQTMRSKAYEVIKPLGHITPRNVQSHGDRAMLWESQIYEGEPE
jgi:hypothetical protein